MKIALMAALCAGFLMSGLFGCSEDETTLVNTFNSGLRVIHTSYDAPAVDVFLDSSLTINDLAFGQSSGYGSVLSQTYNVRVTDAADETSTLIDLDRLVLMPLEVATVFAMGNLADIRPVIAEDSRYTLSDQARVRFVHASPDAPPVDIRVVSGEGTKVFSDISFTEVSAYEDLTPGTYAFVVTAADDTTPVVSFEEVELEAANIYTIVAMGTLAPEDAFDFMVRVFIDTAAGNEFVDLVPAS
jgi:hypothetical protein